MVFGGYSQKRTISVSWNAPKTQNFNVSQTITFFGRITTKQKCSVFGSEILTLLFDIFSVFSDLLINDLKIRSNKALFFLKIFHNHKASINKMDKAVEYSGTEFFCQRFDLKLPQAFVLVAADVF